MKTALIILSFFYGFVAFSISNNEANSNQEADSSQIIVLPVSFLNDEYVNTSSVIDISGTTIYFTSNRLGSTLNKSGKPSMDVWSISKKSKYDTVYSAPLNIREINTSEDEGPLSIAIDNQTFYYSIKTDKSGSYGDVDIYTVLKDKNNKFSEPKNLGVNINSKYWDSNPSISPAGDKLFFASNRPGPNGEENYDIWFSEYDTVKSMWQPARNLKEINTKGIEFAPFIAADGLTLFFSSDSYKPNYGGLDIYLTKYDPKSKKWSELINLCNQFNTVKDEMYINLPPTGDVIYISSRTKDIKGTQTKYHVEMICPRAIIEMQK